MIDAPSRQLYLRPAGQRPHGIRPIGALNRRQDWGEQALQRTWRSAGTLSLMLAVLCAGLHAWLAAAACLLTGLWAHHKGSPALKLQG